MGGGSSTDSTSKPGWRPGGSTGGRFGRNIDQNEMSDECYEARQNVYAAREKLLQALKDECQKCSGQIDFNEENPKVGVEESGIDVTKYKYPFTNMVCEGGGIKGLAYCGVARVLEECGVMPQLTRFAGTSMGSIMAMLLSVGYNSYDIEKIMTENNLNDIARDASYGFLSVIPNLINYYGWHPGKRIMTFLGTLLEAKTGNANITFAELYEKTGTELCIVVTNVNTMTEEYLHVKTTPNMPVALAVRMSISIPGFYQAVKHKLLGKENYYVDGMLLCNFPIQCFDGWWLSMKPRDSFLERLQPIDDLTNLMDRNNRFKRRKNDKSTIGCALYSNDEIDYLRRDVLENSGVPRGPLPDTKLARAWAKAEEEKLPFKKAYKEIAEATTAFMECIGESNRCGKTKISKSEFENAFTAEKFRKEYSDLLFGEDCDPLTAFKAVDKNGNGEVTYNELISFVEDLGVCISEEYRDNGRTQIPNFLGFLSTIINALGFYVMKIYMRPSDVDRTVGIRTWHIKSLDFDLEREDQVFLIDQGKRSTIKFLENFVKNEKPDMLSDNYCTSEADRS